MIGICDVSVQAANPNMPLYPLRAFVNSPSSLRIRNVPKRIGDWNISSVQLVVTYPDNTVKTVECKLIGNVWVGTVAGSSITGRCENGYTVFASGNDENGNPVSNYALGKGLVEILEADTELKPGADIKYVRIFDEEPETPKDGDVWQISGAWYIYQDGQSWPIGDDSGLIDQLSAELSTKLAIADFNNFKTNELAPKIQYLSVQIDTTNGNVTSAQQDIESLSANKLETSTFNNFKSDELTAYATQEWTNTQLSAKQDALTPAQLSAVDSGITSAKVAQYDNAASNLNYAILSLSPTSITATIPVGMFPIKVTIDGTTYTANTAGIETVAIVPQSNGYWLVSYFGGDSNLAGYFNQDGTFDQIGPDVQDLTFGTDDHIPTSSDTLNLNYTYTLQDRAVNLFDLIPTVTKCYLAFPSGVAGHARDFLICVTTHAGTYANPPEMLIDEETGIIINNGGTIPELATSSSQQSTTIVRFSEIYEDGFAVSQPITNTQLSEITTKLNYELSTLTPTNGDPYILASMLPIAVTIQGTTTTITDPSKVYMDKLGTEPNQVYDLLWTNGTSIFITLATCQANGIYIGHGTDVDTITFGGNIPVADTTQILGFKKNYILDDRTINTISVEPTSYMCNLIFPDLITGHARDFIVNTVASAGAYSTPPTLSASGVTLMNAEGAMPEIATDENAAKTTLVYFSEIAANTFLVKGEALETIS